MTREDKFYEVYGQRPDKEICPIYCICENCEFEPYRGCINLWWDQEYSMFDKVMIRKKELLKGIVDGEDN